MHIHGMSQLETETGSLRLGACRVQSMTVAKIPRAQLLTPTSLPLHLTALHINLPRSTFRVCKGSTYPRKGCPVSIGIGRVQNSLPPVLLLRLEYSAFFVRDPDTLVAYGFRPLGTVSNAVATDN